MAEKVKGTAPPLCKMCKKRHWGLCPDTVDVRKLLSVVPKNALGRRAEIRHGCETEHVAEELDASVKPKRKAKK